MATLPNGRMVDQSALYLGNNAQVMLKRLMVFFIVVVSAGSLRAQAGGGFAELGGSHLTFQFR